MSSRPNIEWVLTDTESLRTALSAMKKQRGLSLEDLYHRMGARLLNRFFRREQEDLYFRTVCNAVESMGYELIIRAPQTTKTQQRLEALRKEREGTRAGEAKGRAARPNPEFDPPIPPKEAQQLAWTPVRDGKGRIRGKADDGVEVTQSDPRRDSSGKIIGELTDQEKSEAEALLNQYGSF